jgi:hypothetical protein
MFSKFSRSEKKMSSDVASIHSTSTMNSSKHLLHRQSKVPAEKHVLTHAEKAAKILKQDRERSERFLDSQATFFYFSMK